MAKTAYRLLVGLLIAAAVASLLIAARNALGPDGSKDFQYSGAHLLFLGTDPYAAWRDHPEQFLLTQVPNYLPTIYLFLLPLGALGWPAAKVVWVVANFGLALFVAWRIWRNPALAQQARTLAALAFLSSTPLRNTIGNGQLGVLVMALVIGGLTVPRAHWRGGLMTLAAAKYSLGAVFVAVLAGRRDWRALAVLGALTLGAYGAFAAMTGTPPGLALLLAPLRTAQGGVQLEPPYTAYQALLGSGGPTIVAALTLLAVMAWTWWRGQSGGSSPAAVPTPAQASRPVFIAALATLVGMPHLIYDFCLLALPFAFGNPFALLGPAARWMLAAALAWYWNACKLIDALHLPALYQACTVAVWAMLLLAALDAARRGEDDAASAT